MVDLHSHTIASDGTLSPEALVNLASAAGLEALAITDHDTFAGFDQARVHAERQGLDLLCGIELSTRYCNKSVHLLGYFPEGEPGTLFTEWIVRLRVSRAVRNRELTEKLQACGVKIPIDNLLQQHGDMLGRPHFAAAMVQKGYVGSVQQAFDEYLAESGSCFVQRDEPLFADAAQRIARAGGIASLAHPCRVSKDAAELADFVADMKHNSLTAIEVFHSDHTPAQVAQYSRLAQDFDLSITGGSDFHGTTKPGIELGSGRSNNLNIPVSVLQNLRRSFKDTRLS